MPAGITRPLIIIATKTVAHTRGGDESFEWVDAEDLHGIDLLADLASPHVRADRGARGSRDDTRGSDRRRFAHHSQNGGGTCEGLCAEMAGQVPDLHRHHRTQREPGPE